MLLRQERKCNYNMLTRSDYMYSIKMRSSVNLQGKEVHVSGAEKIISEKNLEQNIVEMVRRALIHTRGKAEFINLKIEELDDKCIKKINALSVCEIDSSNPSEAKTFITEMLKYIGVINTDYVFETLRESYDLRGAAIFGLKSNQRIDSAYTRGIRATYMDYENSETSYKNQFKEAIVLATKVAHAPGIIGEICISDDPECTTGYFASKSLGYIRIYNIKKFGDCNGGRVFIHNEECRLEETVNFIQNEKVIVCNIKNSNDKFTIN